MNQTSELLTVREAAELLNRTERALRWLLDQGRGPKSALIGGRRMLRRHDVDAWIAAAFDEQPA